MPRTRGNTLLQDVGITPKQISRELRLFSKSARVLSSSHPRLINKYPKQWVGIYRGKVIASAKDMDVLLGRLRQKKIPPSEVIVRYIDKDRRKLIL